MSETKQSSHIKQSQATQNINIPESDAHIPFNSRISIARSHSAPQSQKTFAVGKQPCNEKVGTPSAVSPSKTYTNGSTSTRGNENMKQIIQSRSQGTSKPEVESCSQEVVNLRHQSSMDIRQRRENFISAGRSQDLNIEVTNGKESLPNHQTTNAIESGPITLKSNGLADAGTSSKHESQLSSGNPICGLFEQREHELHRHTQRYPFRQAQSEVIVHNETRRLSLVHVKEISYTRLEDELRKAQEALEKKDEEVGELKGIREVLMSEVSEFTASLFEEVNSQLNAAALSEQQARKQLQEANAKIEVLTAEVVALKDLVLTSTPSSPNRHLHPQIDSPKKEKGSKPFWKTHRRSTSHHQFTKESREKEEASQHHSLLKEIDTVVFDEFSRWRLQPTMEMTGQFFSRVQAEDIQPCLNFKNVRLSNRLFESVKNNTLTIEPIPGVDSYPRKCSLSETSKLCNYKIKFEGDSEWYSISQMARNRIAAVCDFFSYVRYIVQGLVKCSEKDMYAELVKLRGQMAQARLGLI